MTVTTYNSTELQAPSKVEIERLVGFSESDMVKPLTVRGS